MTADEIRQLERTSIRSFVESCADNLGGRVLDVGCGLQPYRDVVEAAGGEYVGYDRVDFPANVSGENIGPDPTALRDFDAVLLNQVIQYAEEPLELLLMCGAVLRRGGVLVVTGPTNWPEWENDDLFRYTQAGIEKLLRWAGFDVVRIVPRAGVSVAAGFGFSLGWGALARA